jgi:exopolyphosphatase/guanosine-5'-triphosphate,3'-diphosphate pyrophosphatase
MLRVVDSVSRIVRLGEGMTRTGELSENAMSRTIDALAACKRKLDKHDITHFRFVATEACRRAANNTAFIARIAEKTEIEIEIISPEEEAKLAMLGCYSLIRSDAKYALAFDIGGGSTEVMWVKIVPPTNPLSPFTFEPIIEDWISIPYGVMNLSEQMGSPGYAELYFDDIVGRIIDALSGFDKKNNITETITEKSESVQFISTSGTATTLAAIQQKLPRYERSKIDGIRLKNSEIHNTITELLQMRPSERFAHPCIGVNRSDYILAGCAIFKAITSLWSFHETTIADRGVREGIIMSLILNQTKSGA